MSKKIVVVGTVEIEKSTITKELQKINEDKNIHFYIKEEKYIYLDKYYSNKEKYCFISQSKHF